MSAGGLHRSLALLYPIPARHRRADTGRAEAGQLLGCDDATLSDLVRRGLPATGEPGRERFDSRDLFNLGLYAGTGQSMSEQVFVFALRWMRARTEALLAPRTAAFSARVECDAPDGCGDAPRSVLARPLPKEYDGDLTDYATDPADAGDDDTVVSASPSLGITATLQTRGELLPLRSAGARAAVREFLGADLRWVKLPEDLQADVDLMLDRGVASCASASRWLRQLCVEAGVPATTRMGWVVGMEMVHAWVEIEDTDGVTKVLDPIFALFAAMAPGANPVFRDPDQALRTNRLVPTALAAGEPLARHSCGGRTVPARLTTKILPKVSS
ncbi:hypothetical protein [Micromonospora echinofusca]|uniref:Transglutaminase-like superfamily protein n=1 Tax=Micromonospora echinofusca TaxID=47858 RepID=A0ABS3VWP6_MICEH|nr:hypothetical protein [Micromonospora echinofusca]MBO4208920.1 hypothetical protein [Micromonospora echinofusca]